MTNIFYKTIKSMKSMKNLFVIGLTFVIYAGFTACDNDDDKQEVTLPTIFEGKRITQCESTANGYTERNAYNYSNGKLISYSEYEISNKETFEVKKKALPKQCTKDYPSGCNFFSENFLSLSRA